MSVKLITVILIVSLYEDGIGYIRLGNKVNDDVSLDTFIICFDNDVA